MSRPALLQPGMRLVTTALVALVVGTCAAAPVTPPPASPTVSVVAMMSPTEAPTPTPSPTATATPISTPTPSPSASAVPAGLTGRVVVADQAFAITLAPSWKTIAMQERDIAAVANLFPAGSYARTQVVSSARTLATDASLWAMDLAPEAVASGVTSSVIVLVGPYPGKDMDLLGSLIASQDQRIPQVTGPVVHDVVDLPAGTAARVSYRITAGLAAGTKLEVAGVQYVLASGEHSFLFWFSYPYAKHAAYEPVITAMARSIDFTP